MLEEQPSPVQGFFRGAAKESDVAAANLSSKLPTDSTWSFSLSSMPRLRRRMGEATAAMSFSFSTRELFLHVPGDFCGCPGFRDGVEQMCSATGENSCVFSFLLLHMHGMPMRAFFAQGDSATSSSQWTVLSCCCFSLCFCNSLRTTSIACAVR